MKKLLSIMFAIILICSMVILTSCNDDDDIDNNSTSSSTTAAPGSSSTSSSSSSSATPVDPLPERKTEVKNAVNAYRSTLAVGDLTDETQDALNRAFNDICARIDALTAIDDVNAAIETYKSEYKAAYNSANIAANKVSEIKADYKTKLDAYAATMDITGKYGDTNDAEFADAVSAAKNLLDNDELTSKAALDAKLAEGKTAIKNKADAIKLANPAASNEYREAAKAKIDEETAKYGVNGWNNDGTEAPGKTYTYDLTGMLEEDREALLQIAADAKVAISAASSGTSEEGISAIVNKAKNDAQNFYDANKNSITAYVTAANTKLSAYLRGYTKCYDNDVYDSKIHDDRLYAGHTLSEIEAVMNDADFSNLTTKAEIDNEVQSVKNAMYAKYLEIARGYTPLS